jgi:hypothetical protein
LESTTRTVETIALSNTRPLSPLIILQAPSLFGGRFSGL